MYLLRFLPNTDVCPQFGLLSTMVTGSFDKISPWIVFGRYLFQAGSAGLNQQRKFLYWPLGDWLITVIWCWLWNFPITLKQSGYLSAKSSLTLRSGFLDIPYCDGVPGSGVVLSGFWPSVSVKKRWQQIFGLRTRMRFLDVPYGLSLAPQKADSTIGNSLALHA